MKQLIVRLQQDYKSFKSADEIVLDGDLIILSGVNGGGKSQLLDVIAQRESHGRRGAISSVIVLDGHNITRGEVLRRSFKENIEVPELTRAGTDGIDQNKKLAWDAYNNYLLDHAQEPLWDHQESAARAKKVLIEKFGAGAFQSKRITQSELRDALPNGFVWKSDDVFTNFIGELFYSYALDVYDAQAKAGKSGEKFDPNNLSTPPWKQLNDLLSELTFDYRFRDDYYLDHLQINEQPRLYRINSEGSLDLRESRKLADLSDGEKAIAALSFASLSGVKREDKKILVLDEFDATFNPSLTEAFYKILQKYFIDQGILVIIATHSPTTISLAPDHASFYEVFKKESSPKRLLPVQRDDYAELEIANKTYYAKVNDQQHRIAELQDRVDDLARINTTIANSIKPLVISEGLNIKHIRKAIEILDAKLLESIELLDGVKDKTGKDQLKYLFSIHSQRKSGPSVIIVWDCDAKSLVETLQDSSLTKKFCFEENSSNTKARDPAGRAQGIENLYPDSLFTPEVYETEQKLTGYSGQTIVTAFKKEKFLAKIQKETTADFFSGYRPLIVLIKNLVGSSQSVGLPS